MSNLRAALSVILAVGVMALTGCTGGSSSDAESLELTRAALEDALLTPDDLPDGYDPEPFDADGDRATDICGYNDVVDLLADADTAVAFVKRPQGSAIWVPPDERIGTVAIEGFSVFETIMLVDTIENAQNTVDRLSGVLTSCEDRGLDSDEEAGHTIRLAPAPSIGDQSLAIAITQEVLVGGVASYRLIVVRRANAVLVTSMAAIGARLDVDEVNRLVERADERFLTVVEDR